MDLTVDVTVEHITLRKYICYFLCSCIFCDGNKFLVKTLIFGAMKAQQSPMSFIYDK